MARRQVWQCLNAKVVNEKIRCAAGHSLSAKPDGELEVRLARRGEPLELSLCQACPDYNEMGPALKTDERGW